MLSELMGSLVDESIICVVWEVIFFKELWVDNPITNYSVKFRGCPCYEREHLEIK